MQEKPEWRIEQYSDEMDPFANIQWFVMQGNIVMAQCEVETHAETILAQYQRQKTYGQALQHISAMTSDSHDLAAAIQAAKDALDRGQNVW